MLSESLNDGSSVEQDHEDDDDDLNNRSHSDLTTNLPHITQKITSAKDTPDKEKRNSDVKRLSAHKKKKKTVTFTLDYLFKKFLEYSEDLAMQRIRAVAHWKISSTENILKSLLLNNLDKIAW